MTIGTLSWSGTNLRPLPSHAYAITGYNASTDKFTLYNPWGIDQPGQLTWSQLQATCSQMAVAATAGTVPISGPVVKTGTVSTSILNQASGTVAGMPPSASAAMTFSPVVPAPAAAPESRPAAAVAAPRPVAAVFESNWEVDSHPLRFAGPVDGVLSALLVDATLASDGLLSEV